MKKRQKKILAQDEGVATDAFSIPCACETSTGGYAIPASPTLADVWKGFLKMQEEDNARWRHYDEQRAEEARQRAEERAAEAKCCAEEEKKRRAEDERRRAEDEKRRAEEEKKRRAEDEKRRAEDEKRRAEDEKRYAKERAEDRRRLEESIAERKAVERANEKRMAYLDNLFIGQWGKLMEQLVNGDLVKLLRARGIDIEQTSTRVKGCVNGENFEFDIIAHDGDTVVVVEVKTTLQTDDVKDFIERLNRARTLLPLYKDKKILGAVGYLTDNANASRMAQKDGLFAIRATGGSASIVNTKDFQPKTF